jgi:hypothetical protein
VRWRCHQHKFCFDQRLKVNWELCLLVEVWRWLGAKFMVRSNEGGRERGRRQEIIENFYWLSRAKGRAIPKDIDWALTEGNWMNFCWKRFKKLFSHSMKTVRHFVKVSSFFESSQAFNWALASIKAFRKPSEAFIYSTKRLKHWPISHALFKLSSQFFPLSNDPSALPNPFPNSPHRTTVKRKVSKEKLHKRTENHQYKHFIKRGKTFSQFARRRKKLGQKSDEIHFILPKNFHSIIFPSSLGPHFGAFLPLNLMKY